MYSIEYLNFGHPVGVVLPRKIDGTIKNEELILLIENNKLNFKIIDKITADGEWIGETSRILVSLTK